MTAEHGEGTSRRRALLIGGAVGGMALAAPLLGPAGSALAGSSDGGSGHLPVSEIEDIVGAKGEVSNGVLDIEIERKDIPNVRKEGVPIKPAFQINGHLRFQALSDHSVMMNGDLAFKPGEIDPAIDQMIKHGMAWQALHQHLDELHPMVWFQHMRMRGSARKVAEACHAVLKVTSTPLPQAPPAHPTTPLDAKRLGQIIGQDPMVGDEGVVSIDVPRSDHIRLDGVRINPFLNIQTSVEFEPLGGDRAVAVPDFGMIAEEINPVAEVMRAQGWEIDCLYNQETDEQPQLYFSHMFKVGNAYTLAHEVRRGLERMKVVLH
jgi:Domain of Unknown Function (DUF1259)